MDGPPEASGQSWFALVLWRFLDVNLECDNSLHFSAAGLDLKVHPVFACIAAFRSDIHNAYRLRVTIYPILSSIGTGYVHKSRGRGQQFKLRLAVVFEKAGCGNGGDKRIALACDK